MSSELETLTEAANASFFGAMGASVSFISAGLGSAYATARCNVGLSSAGVMNPDAVVRNLVPIIMAGVLAIYGLIISVMIVGEMGDDYTAFQGYAHLAAGLSVGMCSLGSGYAIGLGGDAATRAISQTSELFVPCILILIFAGAPALYGLLVSILLINSD